MRCYLMNKLVENIIKEELLVFKLNKKILKEHEKLVIKREDWYSLILKEYLKEQFGSDFDPRLLDEAVISEGLWSKAKHFMTKFPNIEQGGKLPFFGRGKAQEEAKAKLAQIIAKVAQNAITKDLMPKIAKEFPEFPNMEDQAQFVEALVQIGIVYDSVYAATEKQPEEKGYLDPVSANAIIDNLRSIVRHNLDYTLKDVYKHFTEQQEIEEVVGAVASTDAPESRSPQLQKGRTAAYAEPEGPKGQFTQRGKGREEAESTTIKGLESNLFPALLAAGGLASLLAGVLIGAQWFQDLLLGPKEWTEKIKVLKEVIQPGQPTGASQWGGQLLHGNAGHYGPNTSAQAFIDAMKAVNPGGGSALDTASQMATGPNGAQGFMDMFNKAVQEGAKFGKNATMEQVFPASGIGGDPALQMVTPDKVVGHITKTIVKKMSRTGGSAVVAGGMTAVGHGVLVPLGIGLMASGAAVKLLRMKGMKSSRAQLFKDLLEEMPDVPVPEGSALKDIEDIIEPDQDDAEQTSDEIDQDDAEQTSDEIEPTPDIEKEEEDDTIQLSGTEMKLMQSIAKVKGTNLNKVINKTVRNLGAALKQPKIKDIVQKFNKTFYPKFNKMIERANIAVAEGIELEEELTGRQQAHKKGKLRSGKAAMRYFKSVGGKPPLLVTQIEDALRDALISKVSADTLFDAVADLENKTKDPEEIKFLQKDTLKMLEKNPRQRLQIYKKNVDVFIEEVAKLATESIADALGGEEKVSKLPENIQESKTLERWKLIAGIK
jgi:hypothetical protein